MLDVSLEPTSDFLLGFLAALILYDVLVALKM